jgi:hypothetical protein
VRVCMYQFMSVYVRLCVFCVMHLYEFEFSVFVFVCLYVLLRMCVNVCRFL